MTAKLSMLGLPLGERIRCKLLMEVSPSFRGTVIDSNCRVPEGAKPNINPSFGEERMAKIAFVGLGNMGFEMATRLLQAGHQMSLYNRTVARAESLVRQGAQLHGTPRDACQGADAVIS